MPDGHGIMGFVDGSSPCPHCFTSSESGASEVNSGNSSANVENDEYKVWKMHDHALMQLITATLSPVVVSCTIGSTSSKNIWTHLKEHFSIIEPLNTRQLCNQEGHTAPFCPNQFRPKSKCYICGRNNHRPQYCFYKDKDP